MAGRSNIEKWSQWTWPGLCLILAVLLIVVVYQNYHLKQRLVKPTTKQPVSNTFPSEQLGRPAPPFGALSPDGQQINVRTDSLSAPMVLLWFAYDCETCVRALPFWNRLADEYPGQVWGMITHGGRSAASEFSNDHVRFPIFEPATPELIAQYGVNIIPQTMVIHQDGVIGQVWHGTLSDSALQAVMGILRRP